MRLLGTFPRSDLGTFPRAPDLSEDTTVSGKHRASFCTRQKSLSFYLNVSFTLFFNYMYIDINVKDIKNINATSRIRANFQEDGCSSTSQEL